jgi:hypothetical protein
LTVRPAILDRDVLGLDETHLAKASAVRGHPTRKNLRHCAIEKADHRHRRLLRARRERPRYGRADKGDKLAPSHACYEATTSLRPAARLPHRALAVWLRDHVPNGHDAFAGGLIAFADPVH